MYTPEYSTKLLEEKKIIRTKWIRKTKRGQYSNNKRLGVYVLIRKGEGKDVICYKKITP